MNPPVTAAIRPAPTVVVTGPAREGIAFLARLLGELGFRTGSSPEILLVGDSVTGIRLQQVLADRQFTITHAYIPVDELAGGDHDGTTDGAKVPTTPPPTGRSSARPSGLAQDFFQLIHTLTLHEVPFTLLWHTRLRGDWAYAYHKLWPLVKTIDPERFRTAFGRIAAAARTIPADPAAVAAPDHAADLPPTPWPLGDHSPQTA